jgi:hypothetical protein
MSVMMRGRLAWLLALVLLSLPAAGVSKARAQTAREVDTALVVSVDVSNSVDAHRYKLQMEGIAKALEDRTVIDAITGGGEGRILFSMVTWADKPRLAIPWRLITNAEDAREVAQIVRTLPHQGGEFTCLAGMLRTIADKIVTQIPAKAKRVVIDVSGDGKDNCNPVEPSPSIRDELVGEGVTINGLPILEGDDGPTLEDWYRENVMGGSGAFVLPAAGFDDFGRAIRQKFIVEISSFEPASPAFASALR